MILKKDIITDDNPLLSNKVGTEKAYITLEKVLASTDSTLEEIITSTVDIYEYNNVVEITGFDYGDSEDSGDPGAPENPDDSSTTTEPQRDRIRTIDRYIILPGVQHDSASSEIITIHPPTGDSSISIVYYLVAIVGLAVLAAGVFGIKKFVVKK